jgi:hypothetical protein
VPGREGESVVTAMPSKQMLPTSGAKIAAIS